MQEPRGIPGYPGGYVEPRYAFREHLAAPLHQESLVRAEATPPEGAVVFGDRWRLVLPEGAGEQVETAAEDFRRFMEVGMGLAHPRGQEGASEGPSVLLALSPTESGKPEAYEIEVAESGVTIRAGDESGLQYGLYELEEWMSDAGGPWLRPGKVSREPFLETRILRSFYSPYYANELLGDVEYYPDELLNRLAHQRINGIWIHVLLREVVKSDLFPEFGADADQAMASLNRLIRRAARYGIRVFLYLLEPRSFPKNHEFWERHPEIKGAARPDWAGVVRATAAMCTSLPEVREWLTESCRRLFTAAPGLGGAFCITSSEAQTNCYSHYPTRDLSDMEEHYRTEMTPCPRCTQRKPEEVVVEVHQALRDGIHAANPQAKVIAWDWSWEMLWGPETADAIVASLPEGVILMCDFERGDWVEVLGKKLFVDEYSLSFIGPSARFRRFKKIADQRGTPVYAKMQYHITHELASVPYMPLPENVFDKFTGLRRHGVRGILGCWIFGNYPGMITNLAAGTYFREEPREEALQRLAQRYFAAEAAPEVLAAWREFTESWSYYPYNTPLIYDGPMTAGPAFPWFVEPIHAPFPGNWLPDQPVGDNMLHQIPEADVLWFDACLRALLEHWAAGLAHLEKAFEAIPEPRIKQLQEYGLARCIYHQMTTLRNTARFYVEREFLLRSENREERRAVLRRLQGYIRDEIANAEACLPYVEADTRLGWHSEADTYQFTPDAIRTRNAELRRLAEEAIPEMLENDSGLVEPTPYAEPLSDRIYPEMRAKLEPLDLVAGFFPT